MTLARSHCLSGDYSRGGDRAVDHGTGLAVIVREGSEAEARRAVETLRLLQFAIIEAFCSCGSSVEG